MSLLRYLVSLFGVIIFLLVLILNVMSEAIGYLSGLRSKESDPLPKNASIEVLSTEDIVVDGVQSLKQCYKCDDPFLRFIGMKCSDFALSNLLAAGVDLKHCVVESSSFKKVASVEAAFVEAINRNVVLESQKTDVNS